MTNKSKCLEKLKELNYECEIVNGIIYIYNIPLTTAKNILNEIGYDESWGIKI